MARALKELFRTKQRSFLGQKGRCRRDRARLEFWLYPNAQPIRQKPQQRDRIFGRDPCLRALQGN